MSAAETWRLNAGDETRVMDGRNNPVCDVKCGGMSGRTVAEGEKIARLIAAAPALLEALEAIDKVVSGYKSQMKFCDIEALGYFREFVRRIEATKHAAAIALAKGESA